MTRPFLDPVAETNLLDEVARRRQRLSALRRTVTPVQAANAVALTDAYPWMDPGVVQSMTQAGLAPDSPAVQSIADLAAEQAAEDGEFDQQAEDVPDSWLGTLTDVAFGWAKPVVRTGFTVLATPMEELQALLSAAGTALFDETEAGELGLLSDVGGNIAAVAGELTRPGDLLGDFWTNYTQKAARSTGLLALGDLVEGKTVHLGEGFLPGARVDEEGNELPSIFREREQAKRRLTLDGHFVTPGRLIARQFTEPGTTQYQFLSGLNDFAQNLVVDPANIVGAGLSKAAKANRAFQTVGLIDGIRKTADPTRAVNHYLTSDLGQRLVQWLTRTDSVDEIWRATGRSSLDASRRLAATRTESETFDALSDLLGTVIREKPTAGFASRAVGLTGGSEYGALFGGGARARRAIQNSRFDTLRRLGRLGEDVPRQSVNIHDLDDAARQLDAWMTNAQVPQATRARVVGELAERTAGDQVGVFETVRKAMDDTEGLLVSEWGVTPSRARRLTSLYADLGDDLHTFDLDDVGRHVDVLAPLRVNVSGDVVDVRPTPGMVSELVNDVIPLPSHTEIRRLTPAVKQMQRLYDSGFWKASIDGLDSIMTTVWKPLQLLRGAYMVRVIGEEQVRMAGSGYDSLFRNPMSAIAWSVAVDPKSTFGRKLASAAKQVVDPRGTQTVTGALWDDITEHAAALSRGSAGHRGFPGELLTGRFVRSRYGESGFYQGWATELAHEANDPVMRRVAGGLTDGDLRSIGREAASGSTFDDVAEWWWSGTGQKFRKTLGRMENRGRLLTDRGAATEYLKQNYADRLQRMTGGNPDLVDLVGTGKLDDVNLRGFGHERRLSSLLEGSYDSAAPSYVKAPETVGRRHAGALTAGRLNEAVERSFEALMSRPTNWLSRSPTFRQKYWQRINELIGSAPRGVQEEAIQAARAANIGDTAIRDMAATVLRGSGDRLANIDDLDLLAKSFALDETRKLLYDLQKRSQFFDMMRVVFPFGEAWKEIIGSWTSILRHNPQTLRRFQQTLEGARQPSLLGEAETDEGTGRGFFAPDPVTGEEVFHYPGGGWVSKMLGLQDESGAGVDLTGRVAGLNIVSATVVPGFGPAVQIPASHLIPNTPKWDDLRELVLPFGEVEGPVSAVTPAWLEKIQTVFDTPDPANNRLFANTVTDVMGALQRTGNYNMRTRDGQQRLLDDATSRARILYFIRGAAQFAAPTGPGFTWTASDVDGNVVPVKLLSDELRRMTEEEYQGDRVAAFDEWVRRFGVDNVLATIGKSTSVVERPVTEKGDAWLRAHPALEEGFPLTVGYFAPEPAVGEFDYTAYLRSFETGAREAHSPAEQLALANDFLGRVQWEQAKKLASIRPGPVTSAWLAQVRTQIAEDYPGFDGWVSRRVWQQRPTAEDQITELRRAVENDELANTDAGQGIRKYLSATDAATQMVARLPGNVRRYQQAKSARPVRDWLRSVARQIVEEHPDFARVWTNVFERELEDDPIPLEAAA